MLLISSDASEMLVGVVGHSDGKRQGAYLNHEEPLRSTHFRTFAIDHLGMRKY